jgi:hypothetical protein
MHNEHKVSIPPAVLTGIEGLFQRILAKLEPYRTPLTAEERREMAIIGDKTLAFLIQYVAGNKAYHWMLDFYHSTKQAAGRDAPNAKIVAEELGKRFQNRGRKPSKPAE